MTNNKKIVLTIETSLDSYLENDNYSIVFSHIYLSLNAIKKNS